MAFQVVGYDDAGEPIYQPVAGSVMGSVMGQYGMVPYGGGYGVYGGESEEEVVGRAIAKHRAKHGHHPATTARSFRRLSPSGAAVISLTAYSSPTKACCPCL